MFAILFLVYSYKNGQAFSSTKMVLAHEILSTAQSSSYIYAICGIDESTMILNAVMISTVQTQRA